MEKAGRNDPCPCGSGKKFKKCCEGQIGKKLSSFGIGCDQASSKLTSVFAKQVFKGSSQEKNQEELEKNSTNSCE